MNPVALIPDPGEPVQWHVPAAVGDGWISLTPPAEIPNIDNTDHTAVDPKTSEAGRRAATVDDLRSKLAVDREFTAVKRRHEQIRHVQTVQHRVAIANATEWSTAVERARRERARDAAEATELAQLHRWAARSGERARIRADIQRSAEMRALRVAQVRKYTMLVGFPVMVGFAAISTPGVQAGMAHLLNLTTGSVGWWTAWAVEPLLIAVATSIIVVKSVLKMSGGLTDWRADAAKWGALLFSIALNMLGGWTGNSDKLTALGEGLSHSVGAIGAAVTAWLIGVIVDYASKATPWQDAPRLTDLGLLPTAAGDVLTPQPMTPVGTDPDRHVIGIAPAVTGMPATVAPVPVTPADAPTVTRTAPFAVTPAVTTDAVTDEPAPTVTDTTGRAVTDTTSDDADGDTPTVTPTRTVTAKKPSTDLVAVRPLPDDLIDPRLRDWTVEQRCDYAADKARQIVAGGGTKKEGMRVFLLLCMALGVDPAGTWMAKAVGSAQSLARTNKPRWLAELAVADAEQILLAEHNRIVAEVTSRGDVRG
ncbi:MULTISPECIES: hypothetical protein [unclassified Micromonospora]|uniref:hypothetical protein n=1 Tax=unclassified Micromonospora TaxID=2617518 RepID=UPI003320E279